MNHDLKVLIGRFEVSEQKEKEYFIESYRPGKYRLYSVWQSHGGGCKRLSYSMRSNEMVAWLEGWFMSQTFHMGPEASRAIEEGYNARANATTERIQSASGCVAD